MLGYTRFELDIPNDKTDYIEIVKTIMNNLKTTKRNISSEEKNNSQEQINNFFDDIIGCFDDVGYVSDEDVKSSQLKRFTQ